MEAIYLGGYHMLMGQQVDWSRPVNNWFGVTKGRQIALETPGAVSWSTRFTRRLSLMENSLCESVVSQGNLTVVEAEHRVNKLIVDPRCYVSVAPHHGKPMVCDKKGVDLNNITLTLEPMPKDRNSTGSEHYDHLVLVRHNLTQLSLLIKDQAGGRVNAVRVHEDLLKLNQLCLEKLPSLSPTQKFVYHTSSLSQSQIQESHSLRLDYRTQLGLEVSLVV
jgi:hypothetical protein